MKNNFRHLFIIMVIISLIGCKNTKNTEEKDLKNVEHNIDLNLNYSDTGMDIALATKAQLGKNLIGAIQKEGTISALKYCNIKAYPLTDSMSISLNAKIKRVSDRPRNSENAANSEEIGYITIFKNKLEQNEKIVPIIKKKDEKVHFYAPIMTDQLCLQCHGKMNSDIEPNVLKTIDSLYPNDMATGYSINQIRGIWSIEMVAK